MTSGYDRDIVNSKLSTVNETQESIVTVAQWIMFHRRHAQQTVEVWLERLRETQLHKRLTLIYLVNEVVQQSKARGKKEFVDAFEGIILECIELSYKGASADVQGKLKRVVDVWRNRSVFSRPTLQALEEKIKNLDAERVGKSGGGGKLGGSLFGGSGGVPTELDGVAKSQTAVSKAEAGLRGKVDKASEEYARMTNPDTPVPTAPMHAAQLNKLMKNLAEAHGAVEASINARKELVAGLEKLVESNRTRLFADEETARDMNDKWESINVKRKDVEDAIMHGTTSNPTTPAANGWNHGQNGTEMQAPEAEGFTPPPPDVEEFTPPPEERTMSGDPTPLLGEITPPDETFTSTTGAENMTEEPPNHLEPAPSYEPPAALQSEASETVATNANEFLNNLALPGVQSAAGQTRSASNDLPMDPRLKRRKLSHKTEQDIDRDIFGESGAAGGIDEAGISAMLDS